MQGELFAIEVVTNLRWLQELTQEEYDECVKEGTKRYNNSRTNNRQEGRGPGNNSNGPDYHIGGCLGECVLSKKTGLPWYAPMGAPDVGGLLQVRLIKTVKHHLIVKPYDEEFQNRRADTGPMVVVLKIADLLYHILGWMDARYALENYEIVRKPGCDTGAWVPVDDLRPMEELEHLWKTGNSRPE